MALQNVEARRNAYYSLPQILNNITSRIEECECVSHAIKQLIHESFCIPVLAPDSCAAVFDALLAGLEDYTNDERGDVGSLVRLQALACAAEILAARMFKKEALPVQVLKGDIYRLSLEKLDRVRLQAARCRQRFLGLESDLTESDHDPWDRRLS